MAVLLLNHKGTKAALKHPALLGKQRLARGQFSVVYDNGDTILKLTCDQSQYYMSADGVVAVTNEHAPKLITDHGEVGMQGDKPIYLMEMEKLQKLQNGSDAKKIARRLIRDVMHSQYAAKISHRSTSPKDHAVARLQLIADYEGYPETISDSLNELANFLSNIDGEIDLDFHSGNVMQRNDGTLVINDPFCDYGALYQRRQEIWRSAR